MYVCVGVGGGEYVGEGCFLDTRAEICLPWVLAPSTSSPTMCVLLLAKGVQKHQAQLVSLEKPNGVTDKHFCDASDTEHLIVCRLGKSRCIVAPSKSLLEFIPAAV